MGTLKQMKRADKNKSQKKVCGERVSYSLVRKKKTKRELQHANIIHRSEGNGILHDDTTTYRTRFDSDIQPLLFPAQADSANSFKDFCRAIGVQIGQNWQSSFGVGLHVWARGALPRPIRTLSLFSGAGGLDIGFHDAGFEIIEQVEIEEKFVATLRANSGRGKYLSESKVERIDIREFYPPSDLKVDFIIGGPPCQTFSAAGRRAAGVRGTTDERGTLFEEYVRLLKQLQPVGFLFENVYGITGADDGKAWQSICAAFAGAGYTITPRVLDAADYGVPQHRERMIIVGTRGKPFKFPRPTHGRDSWDGLPTVSAADALAGVPNSGEKIKSDLGGRFGHLLKEIPPGLNYSFFTEKMGHPSPIFSWRSKFSDFLYKADPATPIRTLKAQGGQYTGPFHWDSRAFSVAELKRLQTFPDSYEVVGGRQIAIHQIGNSVPPQLARILAVSVLNQIFDMALPVALPLLETHEKLSFRKHKRSLTTSYRAKAHGAISTLPKTEQVKNTEGSSYHAVLRNDFGWMINGEQKDSLRVVFSPTHSNWKIKIATGGATQEAFHISILPAKKSGWAVPASKVTLSGSALMREVFTGAWKALETELVRAGIKADLVQLCGYYQYTPEFAGKLHFSNIQKVTDEWRVLSLVVEGAGVRKIATQDEIADTWKIPKAKVMSVAKWLRELGYEVRNHKTNPQIPADCLLVPYAFPTFTPQSVQLRKKLEHHHGEKI
jgi:DNA (cytosine-5)-methyltransferase 1